MKVDQYSVPLLLLAGNSLAFSSSPSRIPLQSLSIPVVLLHVVLAPAYAIPADPSYFSLVGKRDIDDDEEEEWYDATFSSKRDATPEPVPQRRPFGHGCGAGNTPGGTGNTPGGTGNTPGGTGNTPGGTGNTPGGTGNIPGGTGNTPGGTGNIPGGTGNTPGGTGNTPGGVGNTPGGTGTTASGTSATGAPIRAVRRATTKIRTGISPSRT